jgi:hypothetical protein
MRRAINLKKDVGRLRQIHFSSSPSARLHPHLAILKEPSSPHDVFHKGWRRRLASSAPTPPPELVKPTKLQLRPYQVRVGCSRRSILADIALHHSKRALTPFWTILQRERSDLAYPSQRAVARQCANLLEHSHATSINTLSSGHL